MSLLLTLNIFHTLFYVNFEHVIAGWDTQGKDYSVRGRNEFYLNPFLASVPILHPLKTPENQRFSGDFRVYKMGTLARNVLISYIMSSAEK